MTKPKYYAEVYTSKEEIPPAVYEQMKFGFVLKYGDDIVTGWCNSYSNAGYSHKGGGMQSAGDTVGIKLNNVIINLDEVFYYHTFVSILGTPVMFFPREK